MVNAGKERVDVPPHFLGVTFVVDVVLVFYSLFEGEIILWINALSETSLEVYVPVLFVLTNLDAVSASVIALVINNSLHILLFFG